MNRFIFKLIILSLIVLLTQTALASRDEPISNNSPKLSVDDFVAEADIRDAEISPNGRYLAVILSQDKVRYVLIRDLEKEGTPIVGTLGDIIFRPSEIKWANNERLLIQIQVPLNTKNVRRDSKSKEDFDIYSYPMTTRMVSVDVNAKNLVVLMEDRKLSSFVSHYLWDDPKHVLMPYYSWDRYTLDKVNVYTGESEVHFLSLKDRTYKIFTDGKGKLLYRLDFLRVANETQIFKYTDDEEWEKIDTIQFDDTDDDDGRDESDLVDFGLTENSSMVYRQINAETGFYELIEFSKIDNKKSVIASLPNQDIVSLILDQRNDKLIGYTTQKDLTRYHYFDKQRQKQYNRAVKQIGNNNLNFYWPVIDSAKAIAITSGPDNPGHFYIFDTKTSKLKSIGEQYLKLKTEDLGIPAVVNAKMRDGSRIRTYILFPPDYQQDKPMPMVILPHGGPHIRDSASYDFLAQFIATRGYMVVQPNFRGSSGYGLEFKSAGFGQWGGLMQDDITDTAIFMIDQGLASKNKICIVGGSYGGYAALMGAIKTPDLYQCSISINGVTDLKKQIDSVIREASSKERDKVTKRLYKEIGNPETDPEYFYLNSPALRAKDVNVPVLIVAGYDDTVVSYKQSKQMNKALRKAGKKVEYINLKGAPHNVFRYIDHKKEVLEKIEEFLGKHLSG